MVKLSAKYLIKKNKRNKYFLIRKKGDSDSHFLKRITHLPLQQQFIEQILKIKDCENVKFLYLQNNLLKNIENMENFPNLTHLYLQRNFLVKIENLQPLLNLKKIYLGHNEIQVLEGMENLKNLTEVHLECQDIPVGGALYFEPLNIQSLGETLHVLNVSENCLTSIKCLKNLTNLRIFLAKYNFLQDIEDITTTISDWRFIQKLNLIGNEVTKSRWYRDAIIFASKSLVRSELITKIQCCKRLCYILPPPKVAFFRKDKKECLTASLKCRKNLEILDDKPIHENTRIFIENLVEQKKLYLKHKLKTEGNTKEKRKTLKFADKCESKDWFDFTGSFPLRRTVHLYPAWRLRTNINSVNPKTFLPRPYWRKGGGQIKP